MPASLISPCSGLSDTQSSVPYGTRKRKPLAATAADSMSRAMARDWDRRRMVAELPVPVVDAGHRPGPHHPLELEPGQSRHFADGLLERNLHLGQRRNRHPQRQLLIEHMILAHISVRQDVVAELLRVPQDGTVAEHQPGMGTKHRDV